MKKFIGVFALTLILTSTFATSADAESPPDYTITVCDVGYETPEFESAMIVKIEFPDVTVNPVNYTGEGGLIAESVSNVSRDFYSIDYTYVPAPKDEPIFTRYLSCTGKNYKSKKLITETSERIRYLWC